jgi:hypothetical protein
MHNNGIVQTVTNPRKEPTMELNAKQRQIINDSLSMNFNEEDAGVYTHYSGRGMYGKTCFGIETEQYTNPISVMMAMTIDLIEDDDYNLARVLTDKVSQDNMGRGMITYFPSIEWGEDEVLDEDDD